MSKSEFVYPGVVLGSEEEFLAGSNSFSDDNGNIVAESCGFVEFDNANHEVKVVSKSEGVSILRKGCHVICVVSSVKPTNVLVQILSVLEKGFVVNDSNGSIAVFNISDSFVRNTEDMFRIGDIVKAKVVNVTTYGIELDTKDQDCGVIKAFGIVSRKPLHLINGVLRDPVTGSVEQRKISSEYVLR